jgi:hypothetical protein
MNVSQGFILRAFLCHSSGDKQTVRELYHQLRSDWIDAWLDEENLLPGQEWQLEIPKAVKVSDIVIVCLSQAAINKKGYGQKEIKYALDIADEQPEGAIFLIPVKLEECDVPDRLQRWQWVNLFEPQGYQRLLLALQASARKEPREQKENMQDANDHIRKSRPDDVPQNIYYSFPDFENDLDDYDVIANAREQTITVISEGLAQLGLDLMSINDQIKRMRETGEPSYETFDLIRSHKKYLGQLMDLARHDDPDSLIELHGLQQGFGIAEIAWVEAIRDSNK